MTDFQDFCDHQIAPRFAILARLSQFAQGFENFSGNVEIAPCARCSDTRFYLVLMPTDSIHHASRRCMTCGVHRGWNPKPQNREKKQQRQTTISQLLESPKLREWEREFLKSVQGKRSLTPKQLGVLAVIKLSISGRV